jgi:hypothetical protein
LIVVPLDDMSSKRYARTLPSNTPRKRRNT